MARPMPTEPSAWYAEFIRLNRDEKEPTHTRFRRDLERENQDDVR